jgi:hypothetical protein
MLTLLFVVLYLADTRLWHWSAPRRSRSATGIAILNGLRTAGYYLFGVQAIILYGHAFIGKLFVPEWLEGTDFWYWIQDPTFAPPGAIKSLLAWMSGSWAGSLLLNYGTLALEAALMCAVLLSTRAKVQLWVLAVAFHLAIAFTFGLWSFLCSMFALLSMYLLGPLERHKAMTAKTPPHKSHADAVSAPSGA